MLLSDLLSHAALCREASSMPPGTAVSVAPLMLTDKQLDDLVDGTGLTVQQWLQVACHGVLLWPHELAALRDDVHGAVDR